MFEFSVACKYLIPRWRQLSVSIISLISIFVIALVVWLILVFFSVTNGLEKNWITKLTAMTAPIRITPTDAYYKSYYYQIDSLSDASGYAPKSIEEKRVAKVTDPYNPDHDEELSSELIEERKSVKDSVKEAFRAIESFKGVDGSAFEMAFANLKIELLRPDKTGQLMQQSISQASLLGSFDGKNPMLEQTILPHADKRGVQRLGNAYVLPANGILLPRSFVDGGVRIGDRGHIAYYTPTASSVREQQLPIFVAGFYDPGVIPIGGKFVLANANIVRVVRAANDDRGLTNSGIYVRLGDLDKAEELKIGLQAKFEKLGIAPYWHIETFREYDFAKDVLLQLQSDKMLFTLIALVIIIVACSNIISMLIILVNDKKLEIGILRAMGATSGNIAMIFGLCGFVMGAIGSCLGTLAALFTLRNLESLIGFLSALQGHAMFNSQFYGKSLPNQLSGEALGFVLAATMVIALLAGVIPAVRASRLKPSAILRSE